MSGEIGGTLGEDDTQIADVSLEETDENCRAPGRELLRAARGSGFRQTKLGEDLAARVHLLYSVVILGSGRWGLVEPELLDDASKPRAQTNWIWRSRRHC